MKKVSLILAALALVLGISQCKKQEEPAASGEKQHIVLNASFGDSNAKIDEDGTGGLKWTVGDVINVSKDGQSLSDEGLKCTDAENGIFEGDINETTGEITFTFGELKYTEQTGELNDAISLTAEAPYDKNGNYDVTMEMPHAVLKLNVSALGTTGKLEIKVGGALVASVTNVSDPTAVFVAIPTDESEKEYKISIGGKTATKPWTLLRNSFYTKSDGEGGGTGDAFVIEPDPTVTLGGVWASVTGLLDCTYEIDPTSNYEVTEHYLCYCKDHEFPDLQCNTLVGDDHGTFYHAAIEGNVGDKYYVRAYAKFTPKSGSGEPVTVYSDVMSKTIQDI